MDVSDRVEAAKREAFLARIAERSGSDPHVAVEIGALGEELGLPYEDALRILDDLEQTGLLRRDPELDPPAGPAAWLTSRGVRATRGPRAA